MKHLLSAYLVVLFLACDQAPSAPHTPTLEQDEALLLDLKVELGRRLFYDTRLSSTKRRSCSHCHLPQYAFSDITPTSFGVHGYAGTRNAPSLMNIGQHTAFNWDGGVPRLHLQALVPLHDTTELDFNDPAYFDRFRDDTVIQDLSLRTSGDSLTLDAIVHALASFQRTLISDQSAYDAHLRGEAPLSEAAQEGLRLFEALECVTCHTPPLFTDLAYHRSIVASDDLGRQGITGDTLDYGKFKTPTLRNIALTDPYSHTGELYELEDVVGLLLEDGSHYREDLDQAPVFLSINQQHSLLHFLQTLTDSTIATNPDFRPLP